MQKNQKTDTVMLGGSFDPVHLGHLFLLHCAVSLTDHERIVIVPAALSNFKQDARPSASAEDRMNMIRLALEDYHDLYPSDRDAELVICDDEMRRGGVSYTSDTVRLLLSRYGLEKISIIIGDDHIASLTKWHEFEYLKEHVRFLICSRNPDRSVWNLIPEGLDYVALGNTELFRESSTAIREDLSSHLDYLSPKVRQYVKEHNLYS